MEAETGGDVDGSEDDVESHFGPTESDASRQLNRLGAVGGKTRHGAGKVDGGCGFRSCPHLCGFPKALLEAEKKEKLKERSGRKKRSLRGKESREKQEIKQRS